MKKENWLIALAAGAGMGVVAYTLLKKDMPKGAIPVQPFDKNRFMGKWHEIARLPNRIEKNLRNLTEEYFYSDDDHIKVITKAYNINSGEWKSATGKMRSAGIENIGKLEVSYFGPFYLAYNVLDIDANYQYALVSGSGLDYLWILSRETKIPEGIKSRFLAKAQAIGFKTDKLEWV